ncbi:hypothetical protein MSSAC_4095 [Methanosarcina siciliae C2J]|uniref:Uncharacterized protein n=2 Tax=Methanosarcina siciliae TaxID=38027 RepID=A0A0E3PHN5_9EURY|nr:hypothetical protein MSSIH_3630 [Methanosarcina siciliae HI350]AKB38685.1 hypothetical protein MSSAC_4095 [Methanosarcina siciliae C2J]
MSPGTGQARSIKIRSGKTVFFSGFFHKCPSFPSADTVISGSYIFPDQEIKYSLIEKSVWIRQEKRRNLPVFVEYMWILMSRE